MGFLTTLRTRLRFAFNRDPDVEAKWIVNVSERDVSTVRPDGMVESLAWNDLKAVAIETTDEGPYVMDVFWYLVGEHGGCVVPNGATGVPELLKRLQTLPGFDNAALCNAMASTANAKFILWRKNAT